jgi:hypothetical protein
MDPNSAYTVEVVKTIEGVLALRAIWAPMSTEPDCDIDFYLAVLEARRGEILNPHVIILRKDGIPQSILVGRVERKSLTIGLGYKQLSLPPIRWLSFVHDGLLGENSEQSVSVLMKSIMDSLKQEADVAWFHQLDSSSIMYRLASQAGGVLSRDYFPDANDHWGVQLSSTYAEFLRRRSGNTRHNLKRYGKRLTEAFGDQIKSARLGEASEIESVLADCETVASKSYHRGLQVGFINNDETRRLMTLAVTKRWFRSYILYIGGKPCAFWNGFLYRRTFFAWTTAFDPAYQELRPGLFLLQRVFEDLCQEQSADKVDFGYGDAQYKRDWCDENRPEITTFLFAPTFKGTLLNAVRTPLLGTSHVARRFLGRTGLLMKAKKAWRTRLTPRKDVEGRG